MDWLQNTNIIYLLLTGGLALGILALAAPGTGVLEVIAIFTLGLAGWLTAVNGLPINLWSLGVLLVGVALFVLAVRRPRQIAILILSILALVAGSAYLFAGERWWAPGVNPALAGVVSVLLGGFFWVAARKAIEAEMRRPSHDLSSLIGAKGEARTPIAGDGTVYADGELWTARRAQPGNGTPIPSGTTVRILGRDGFILIVEPAESAPVETVPSTDHP
jgi:membrane-bound serine protease (ClpP class)